MTDPRLQAYLKIMKERPHPFYAAQAYRFAAQAGDTAAMEEAIKAGALSWRPEPVVRMRTEEDMLDRIITGDAREIAKEVPDGSIDLIMTDPVYQNIDDYAWLAETALRVLAPKGAALVWCSKPKLARSQIAMENAGLEYVYTLDYTVTAKTYRMRWYNLFCWSTPCLWMQRDGSASRPRRWIPDVYNDSIMLDGESVELRKAVGDTFVSTGGPSGGYIWNKNLGVLKAWLDAFSAPGATIWDPFTGSGSVPVVCRLLGRHFYASEIKSDVAAAAQQRLDNTPLPMKDLLSVVEQGAFSL